MPRSRRNRASASAGRALSPSRSCVRASRTRVAERLAASPHAVSSRRREPCERLLRRRALAAGPDDRPLDLERSPCLDELAADRPNRRVRDGRATLRTHAAQRAHGRSQERIAAERPVEVRRVVVGAEHEPGVGEATFARGLDRERPVSELSGACPALPREPPAPHVAPRREPQRVRASRTDDRLDHRPTLLRRPAP